MPEPGTQETPPFCGNCGKPLTKNQRDTPLSAPQAQASSRLEGTVRPVHLVTGGIALLALLAFIIQISFSGAGSSSAGSSSAGWTSAAGHIWCGVQVYSGQGTQKRFVGEVLGGNERYTDPITGSTFRGVKLRMASGSEEWKDRSSLIQWGYVHKDDPAIQAMQWEILHY